LRVFLKVAQAETLAWHGKLIAVRSAGDPLLGNLAGITAEVVFFVLVAVQQLSFLVEYQPFLHCFEPCLFGILEGPLLLESVYQLGSKVVQHHEDVN
jgi:hypothetical protein